MKSRLAIAAFALLCLLSPKTASAGVPQWPQKAHAHPASHPDAAMRQAPAPTPASRHKHSDEVHRGFDASAFFCSLAPIGRRIGSGDHHASRHRSSVRKDAGTDEGETRTSAILIVRTVDSLPPHWSSTHLAL